MALVQCPECSTQVSNHALSCPSCGCPITKMRDLRSAILRKDIKQVSELIYFGADVNKVSKSGWTPLMLATAKGNVKIVELLLTAGADPAFFNAQGESALTLAISKRRRVIEQLLKRALFSETAAVLQREADAKSAEILARIEPPVDELKPEPAKEVPRADLNQSFGEATLPINFQPPENFSSLIEKLEESPITESPVGEMEQGMITAGMDDEPERITFWEVEEQAEWLVEDSNFQSESAAANPVEFGDATAVMNYENDEFEEIIQHQTQDPGDATAVMQFTSMEAANHPQDEQEEEEIEEAGDATAVMFVGEDFHALSQAGPTEFGESTAIMHGENEAKQEEDEESSPVPSFMVIRNESLDEEVSESENVEDIGDVTAVMEINAESQEAISLQKDDEQITESSALLFIGNEDFDHELLSAEPEDIGDVTVVMEQHTDSSESIELQNYVEQNSDLASAMFIGNEEFEQELAVSDEVLEPIAADDLSELHSNEEQIELIDEESDLEEVNDQRPYGEDTLKMYIPEEIFEPEPAVRKDEERTFDVDPVSENVEPSLDMEEILEEDPVQEMIVEEILDEPLPVTARDFEEPAVQALIAEWTKEAEAQQQMLQSPESDSLPQKMQNEPADYVWFDNDEELDTEVLSCPECGHAIGMSDIICSNCKAWVSGRFCSNCSNLITDDSTICSNCGDDVTEYVEERSSFYTKFMSGAAAAVLVLLVVFFVNAQKPSKPVSASNVSEPESQSVPKKSAPVQLETDTKQPVEIPHVRKGNEPRIAQTVSPSKTDSSISQGTSTISPKPSTPKQVVPKQKAEASRASIKPENTRITTKKNKPRNTVNTEIADSKIKPETKVNIAQPKEQVDAPVPTSIAGNSARSPLPDHKLSEQQRIRKGRYLNSVGFTLIKRGETSEAVEVLERAVQAFPPKTNDPHYAYALFNLAVAWRKAGRPDRAIPILEERLKINNQREVVERELLTAKRQAGRSN